MAGQAVTEVITAMTRARTDTASVAYATRSALSDAAASSRLCRSLRPSGDQREFQLREQLREVVETGPIRRFEQLDDRFVELFVVKLKRKPNRYARTGKSSQEPRWSNPGKPETCDTGESVRSPCGPRPAGNRRLQRG